MPISNGDFEIVFRGTHPGFLRKKLGRFKRRHQTMDDARTAAVKLLARLDGQMRSQHSAVIFGPGCGPEGKVVS